MQDSFPRAIRMYTNDDKPPLPESNDTFDLVYCGSVFSHLTDWAPWLLELRRCVLKPGGALVASLHGRGFWELGFHGARGVPWGDDNTGMLVEHYGSTFDDGWGPAVYVSEWWIRGALGASSCHPALRTGWLWVAREPKRWTGLACGTQARTRSAAYAFKPRIWLPPTLAETAAALRERQLAYEEVEHLTNYMRSATNTQTGGKPAMTVTETLPYPPLELANRVGSLEAATEPMAFYDELGARAYAEIVRRLPQEWTFADKRILDFGCGAGRTLRHFVREATEAEIWGCDIDEPSIAWLSEYLCPPFNVFLNKPAPPLDQPSCSFDLIWGISVFTHLADDWSRWLVELHRLLSADWDLLYLTFMGSGTSQLIAGESWDDTKVGMNVLKYGQSWDLGGPMVMHSPWWIEEHWGRAFEIISLSPDGFGSEPSFSHGSVAMRKRDERVDAGILERIVPGDTRETLALASQIVQARTEARGSAD